MLIRFPWLKKDNTSGDHPLGASDTCPADDGDKSRGIIYVLNLIERAHFYKSGRLNLSMLDLTMLPPEIGQLTTLTQLDLSGNLLTTLPPEIGNLRALTQLSLSSNQLTALPKEIGQLTSLTRLSLPRNQLRTLPSEIGQLTLLTLLSLSDNQLTMLPLHIEHLAMLTGLYLSSNRLTMLPPEIGNLRLLSELHLSNNQLTTLPPEIGQLRELTQISLSNNHLTALPPQIGHLTVLTQLDLSGNLLTTLPPEIGNLRALTQLPISNNHLATLPREIGQLTALTHLSVSNNQLTTLPPEIGQLAALTELYLSNNQLTILPKEMQAFHKLQNLNLQGNPALNLPEEVLGSMASNENELPKSRLPQEILDYYFANVQRAAAHGTQPLNEAKVIVLGEAAVGKSSLILALTEGTLKHPLEKTHGIVQKPWPVPLRGGRPAPEGDQGDESLRLNLWDFGGQEVYHSTHTFFLTRRAVYLLVVDARSNDRQNNLEYWLQVAASFGADAPIWIAINKCDQHGAGPDEQALKRRFQDINIRGFLRTSCWTGDGIPLLKEKLVTEALSLEGVRRPMNKIWIAIKHALETMKEDTISLDDYRALCVKHKEKEPGMPEKLLDLWDCLGTVRYFPERPDDPPEMRDSAILNPEWVTKAVYAVLDDHAVRNAEGLAVDEDFQRILKKSGYLPERARMIEQVMRRFHLLYDTPEHIPQHKMLIPQLLPEREPERAWPQKGTLGFVYRYSVLPTGLVPSFIARSHRRLSRTMGPWRHGCVLDFPNGARAHIIGDSKEDQVTISVTGRAIAARDALDAVRGIFEEMHAIVPRLAVEELIPVPRRPDVPLVSYRLLRTMDLNSQFRHFCQGASDSELVEIDIREVLNAVRGEKRAEVERQQIVNFYSVNANPNFPMGDYIAGNQTTADHSTHIGGHVINSQIGQTLTNCRNLIQQQSSGETQVLLEQLRTEVQSLIEKLPDEKAQTKAAKNLERTIEAATSDPPERPWYSVSSEGLLDAAKTAQDFTSDLTKTLLTLGKLLWPGFKLPG